MKLLLNKLRFVGVFISKSAYHSPDSSVIKQDMFQIYYFIHASFFQIEKKESVIVVVKDTMTKNGLCRSICVHLK